LRDLHKIGLRLAKGVRHDLNDTFEASLSAIANEAGCDSSRSSPLKWFAERLSRLQGAKLDYWFLVGRQSRGRLIDSFARSRQGVSIRFDPPVILYLFGNDQQFLVNSCSPRQLRSAGRQSIRFR
jgi:hypothetical protein